LLNGEAVLKQFQWGQCDSEIKVQISNLTTCLDDYRPFNTRDRYLGETREDRTYIEVLGKLNVNRKSDEPRRDAETTRLETNEA
jgi:hypothetical protein